MPRQYDYMNFANISREVSVYSDWAGLHWWTRAWFNNDNIGEPSVPIERETAIGFINDEIGLDEMLETYFPEQMKVYNHAVEQTMAQIINSMTL